MRASTSGLAAAILSAAILAACSGGNNRLSSSTALSVTPSVAAPDTALPQSLRHPASGDYTSRHVGKNGVVETVLYSFGGPPDGLLPIGNLHNVNGTLYGTTEYGGAPSAYAYGTVYKITTSGPETVLYRSLVRPTTAKRPMRA